MASVGGGVLRPVRAPAYAGVVGEEGPEVVLLGTCGGPVPGRRFHTSSALVFRDAVYLVDAGDGLAHQFAQAGLRFDDLRAHFITHLHSDHMAGYYSFYLLNWVASRHRMRPVEVFGPGRADGHGPPGHGDFPAGLPEVPGLPLVNPQLPTPGVVEITGYERQAAAYDVNIRLRDGLPEGRTPPEGLTPPLVEPHEVPLARQANFRDPCPQTPPVKVYEDDLVRVTAALVYHWPVFPAFAYRFDTEHGSVVFSGDTSPVANLYGLAHRADMLVNEAVYAPQILKDPGTPLDPVTRHVLSAHTQYADQPAIQDVPAHDGVGTVARKAEVGTLVLNHLLPGDGSVPDQVWTDAIRKVGYQGDVRIGNDLMRIPLSTVLRRAR
ncbi:MBL fold metallo-hydrolase [Actinomadura sp. HBU206391]|uniref:MBL fold metallo-hydrolase n=1 Tax=Actinomadura sp. HBU206391 TaxID=2731692 RepID=UPI0021CAC52C